MNLSYEDKLKLANEYIERRIGLLTWNDLPDINSLHSAETIQDVYDLCEERFDNVTPPDDLKEYIDDGS